MNNNGCRESSAIKALISGLIGILFFLIFLIILGYIADQISWPLLSGFVDLLYANAALIIIFSVLFMFGEIFATFRFPFNLPFPLFSAIASVLLVSFILAIMAFIDSFYSLGIGQTLQFVKLIVYPLTFIVVMITGFRSIFSKPEENPPVISTPAPDPSQKEEERKTSPSWEDIGGEFRQAVYDLVHRIRDELNLK
ncbi:MAG TPA: hypothetical protein PKG69_03235 [Methanoregulaceae archaeon]|nr:hypothetical protein [Methanoregulaceae archaeon]